MHRPAPGPPPTAIGDRPSWDATTKTFYGTSVSRGEVKRAEVSSGATAAAAQVAQQQVAALGAASAASAYTPDYEAIAKARDKARELKKLADHREGTQRALLERLLRSEKRYEWQQRQLQRVSTQLAQVRSRLATVASERDAALDAARIAAEESDALRGENELLRHELLRAHSMDPSMLPRAPNEMPSFVAAFGSSPSPDASAAHEYADGGGASGSGLSAQMDKMVQMAEMDHPAEITASGGWQQSVSAASEEALAGSGARDPPSPTPTPAPPPDAPMAASPPRRAPPPLPEGAVSSTPPALGGGASAAASTAAASAGEEAEPKPATTLQIDKDGSGSDKAEIGSGGGGEPPAAPGVAAGAAASSLAASLPDGAERPRKLSVTMHPDIVSDVGLVPMDEEMVLARASLPTKDLDEIEREEAEDAAEEEAELAPPIGLGGVGTTAAGVGLGEGSMGMAHFGGAAPFGAATPFGAAPPSAACAPSMGGGRKGKSAANPFGV